MTTSVRLSRDDQSEARWQQVESLLFAVAELARTELPIEEFWSRILTLVRESLGGTVARFWGLDGDRSLSLLGEIPPEANPGADSAGTRDGLLAAAGGNSPKGIVWAIAPGGHDRPALEALACPLRLQERCLGVLEVIRPASSVEMEATWALDVLASVAELCADFHRHHAIRRMTERETQWKLLADLAMRVHQSLDSLECAFAVANEGCRFLGCDRLSVLISENGVYRVLAISGVATIERRSEVIRHLETLVTAVAAVGTPLNYDGESDGLAPQIRSPLRQYVDASAVSGICVLPIAVPEPDAGAAPERDVALVAENFHSGLDGALRDRLELSLPHFGLALRNARLVDRIPMARFWTRANGRPKRLRRWGALVSVGLFLLVCSLIVPADFRVEARGELQPVERREVFAPDDGIVQDLSVDHGAEVAAGDQLVVLRNPQLELEAKRVRGELQTARQRLAAVHMTRIESGRDSRNSANESLRLSGEEAGLVEQIASLEQQLKLIDDQKSELTVRSPISGRILTWDLPQLLRSRPVRRGQVLMTVADPGQGWMLRLQVPDRRIGYVLDAQRELGEERPVVFVLATDPTREFPGTIERVSAAADADRANDLVVPVDVRMEQASLPQPRAGAGVIARIDCGRRPIAYVWLHDLIDAFRSWAQL